MRKNLVFILLITVSTTLVAQQTPPPNPCTTNPIYRFFDFWIGDWEAFGAKGKGGDSKVTLILDSCVILEEWTSAKQGYAGKSFNTYNWATKM